MTTEPTSFITRAEHDSAILVHKLWIHKLILVFIVILVIGGFLTYKGYRDFQEYKVKIAAERASVIAPVTTVPTTVSVAPKRNIFGINKGGSGKAFTNRPQSTEPPKPITTVTKDAKTGVETTVVTCPSPPPNVTRLDPPTPVDAALYEKKYNFSLKDLDVLAEVQALRTRTDREYGIFVPKAGGNVVVKEHDEPRTRFGSDKYLDIYAAFYRQNTLSGNSVAVTNGTTGYGAALGIDVGTFRVKDLHALPFVEVSHGGNTEIRYGVKLNQCIGGVACP